MGSPITRGVGERKLISKSINEFAIIFLWTISICRIGSWKFSLTTRKRPGCIRRNQALFTWRFRWGEDRPSQTHSKPHALKQTNGHAKKKIEPTGNKERTHSKSTKKRRGKTRRFKLRSYPGSNRGFEKHSFQNMILFVRISRANRYTIQPLFHTAQVGMRDAGISLISIHDSATDCGLFWIRAVC